MNFSVWFRSFYLLLLCAVGWGTALASTVFNADGTYTVPVGVTSIKIAVKGAGGGGGGNDGAVAFGGAGSAGQLVTAIYTVTPGSVLSIVVGNGGAAGATVTCTGTASAGGSSTYAAGGNGGLTGCLGTSGSGGGGGGASAVLDGSTPILVAGGGAGGNGAATGSAAGLAGLCSSTLNGSALGTGATGTTGISFATGATDDGSGGGGGGGGALAGTAGRGVADGLAASTGLAATSGRGFVSSANLLFAYAANCTQGTNGTGGVAASAGATGSVVIDEISSTVSISGQVFLDATTSVGSGTGIASQVVRLFSNTGSAIASTTTNASGNYSFANLPQDTYYVASDSISREQVWASSGNAENSSGPICVGAAPTYTQRSNYTTSPSEWVVGSPGTTATNGPCYGGRRGAVGDSISTVSGEFTANDKEHIIKIVGTTQTSITGVNFGFSNDVVTNTVDIATCPTTALAGTLVVASCQGSMRQFITNAVNVAGANSMRFVPTVAANQTTFWRVTLAAVLPTLTGADITIDGTAFSNVNGSTEINTNDVLLGDTTTKVGRITNALPGLNGPELEIRGLDTNIFTVSANNVVVQDIGFHYAAITTTNATNVVFDRVLFGTIANSFTDPGAYRSSYGVYISPGTNGLTIQNSLIGFVKLGGVFANTNTSLNINVINTEFRSTGMNSPVDEAISFVNLTMGSGETKIDHNLFRDNKAAGIQLHNFNGTYSVTNSTFTNNAQFYSSGGMNINKYGTGLITIKDNIFAANYGNGLTLATGNRVYVSQNNFYGNTSNAFEVTTPTNGITTGLKPTMNADSCNNVLGPTTSNSGIARPVLTSASLIAGVLNFTGTMCATGAFTIEIYKAEAASGDTGLTDLLPAGEGSVYLGSLTNQTGSTFTGSLTGTGLLATDSITALAIRTTTGGLGQLNDTSEFAVNMSFGKISGRVFEDTNANLLASESIGDSNNPVLSGQTVRLFNSTGTQLLSTTTNANGEYSFSSLNPSSTYYVAVDAPIKLVNAVYEQTYASAGTGNSGTLGGTGAGTLCIASDYATHSTTPVSDTNAINPSNGACFAGRQASVADSGTTTIATKEHVTRVIIDSTATAITNVDFGFSLNVVTNVSDTAQQGTLRQFVINANTVTGANSMRFVPSLAQNAGSSTYWSINSATTNSSTSIAISDAYTTIDGTAYSNADGTTVINSNSGTMGYAGVVGVGADGIASTADDAAMVMVNKPELEMVHTSGPSAAGLLVKAANTTIQNMAVLGFGSSTADFGQISANDAVLTTATNVNNLTINNMVLGAKANSFVSPSLTQGNGIDFKDVGTGWSINNNLIGFMTNGSGVFVAGSNTSAGSFSFNYLLNSKYGFNVSNANSTVLISKNKIENSATNGINVGATTSGGVTISENTLASSLGNSIDITGNNNSITKNIITATTGNGVVINSGTANLISKNSIDNNSLLGIDLNANGVTVNDANDSDSGANNLLNFPLLGTASVASSNLLVKGCAPASASLEFFSSDQTSSTCPTGNKNALGDGSMLCYGEGKTYLGSATAPASGSCTLVQAIDGNSSTGLVDFNVSVPAGSISNGSSYITATATSSSSTSEFSPNKQVLEPRFLRVNKSIVSRLNSNDQFTTQIKTGITANAATTTGLVVSTTSASGVGGGVASSGTALSFSASPYEVANTITYTITQVMATGSVSAANLYRTTLQCSNATSGSSTVLPSGKVLFDASVGYSLSLNAADDITCTLEDTPQARLTLNKTVVARSLATDEFTVALTGTGVIAGTTTATTASAASSASTGLITLSSGNTYGLTDTTSVGSSSMANYASSIICTNSNTSSTTVLPTTSTLVKSGSPLVVSSSITPVAGDDIICTYTNNLNLPKITLKKLTRNGVGSFSYTGNNGFVTSTVTTTQDMSATSVATTASNAGQMLTATAVTTTITETLPSSWSLESASCFDNNAALSGNPTGTVIGVLSSSNTLSIDAAFIKNGADLICTFINRFNLPTISGQVFLDAGVGTGGIANDGIKNGSEIDIGGVQLQLTNCSGSLVSGSSTTLTAGDGSFSLAVPSSVSNGSSVCVEEINLANYSSTTVAPSFQSAYVRATDKVTLTWNGTAIMGLDFGDAKLSVLTGNNNKLISPGNSTSLAHSFKAGTAGLVTFSLINASSSPSLTGWSELIYLDNNCDGKLDTAAGDTLLSAPIAVLAEQSICLVVQATAPVSAPENAQRSFNIQASLVFDNLTSVVEVLSNKDTIVISSAALTLFKEVKNVTAGGSFGVQNSAKAGEVLEYKISFINNSTQGINNLLINDATPAYTSFVSATCPTSLPTGITACTTPNSASSSAPVIGGVGAIKWVFTGNLPASGMGFVSYRVKVDE